jgi:tRNA threonylcarbamoyladenosine biosynthesis protein TsaE
MAGDVVALHGDLGAGKTVLSRGLALGLGFTGDVHSPSYALVHEYEGGRLPVFHMDLYRLAAPEASAAAAAARQGAPETPGSPAPAMPDWEEIGLDHYFHQGGVCLVEWAERLPAGRGFTYVIEIGAESETTRRITVKKPAG